MYPVEILPFEIRSKGLAWANIIDALSLLFTTFADPVALKAIQVSYVKFSAWQLYNSMLIVEILSGFHCTGSGFHRLSVAVIFGNKVSLFRSIYSL